jgi:Tfp pilus assembly protein PilE
VDPTNFPVTLSAGTIVTIVIAALVPAVLWAITIQRYIKELLQMHREPERSAATTAQHELVKELYESTAELHANNTKVIAQNTHAIHQLTHYIRWFSRNKHGHELPPELPGET